MLCKVAITAMQVRQCIVHVAQPVGEHYAVVMPSSGIGAVVLVGETNRGHVQAHQRRHSSSSSDRRAGGVCWAGSAANRDRRKLSAGAVVSNPVHKRRAVQLHRPISIVAITNLAVAIARAVHHFFSVDCK